MSDVTDDAPRIRALITDDDPLVRRLIRDTLQADNMTVIAEATTGREAVELALFYRPDVVVMDYMMPEMDGIEATRRIHEQDQEIRVVLLTGSADDALGCAACGPAPRATCPRTWSSPRSRARCAARSTARRRSRAGWPCSSSSTTARRRPAGWACAPSAATLTDREWEVLDLLSGGASNEDIARLLVLSSETVRSHLKNLYRKLERPLARGGRGGRRAHAGAGLGTNFGWVGRRRCRPHRRSLAS